MKRRLRPEPVTLQIRILADADATVAEAVLYGMVLTASAKREPGDRPDLAIGMDLAVARVLAKAARRLERRARGQVKHADDVKTARQAAREREARKRATDLLAGLAPPAGEKPPVRQPRHSARCDKHE